MAYRRPRKLIILDSSSSEGGDSESESESESDDCLDDYDASSSHKNGKEGFINDDVDSQGTKCTRTRQRLILIDSSDSEGDSEGEGDGEAHDDNIDHESGDMGNNVNVNVNRSHTSDEDIGDRMASLNFHGTGGATLNQTTMRRRNIRGDGDGDGDGDHNDNTSIRTLRSQLDGLTFDSCSDEEESHNGEDQAQEQEHDGSLPKRARATRSRSTRTRAKNRKCERRSRKAIPSKMIELLDTDTDSDADADADSDVDSEHIHNDSESDGSGASEDRSETSRSITLASEEGGDEDDIDSPKPFRFQMPSPSNSVFSITDSEHDDNDDDDDDDGISESDDDGDKVGRDSDDGYSSTTSSIDGSDKNTAWRKRKNRTYILKGDCTMQTRNGDGNTFTNVQWPKLNIPQKLYDSLYEHQKVGVQWLASLHVNGIGGILGDDMGLGKTYQTLTLLGGLMRGGTIRNALVVCPVAVIKNWERESRLLVENMCGMKNLTLMSITSSMTRERRAAQLYSALTSPKSHPHIIITSYGLVTSSTLDFLGGRKDDSLFWDYIVIDEGHTIKNPNTRQHKACARIARNRETRRILLSGTPIQNNMKELWALFDWATSGKLFGTQIRFMNQYAKPIEDGRNRNASDWTLKTAAKMNKELQAKLKPHFLQRMKNSEFKNYLPVKKELVVWIHLTDIQREKYENYVVDGGKVAAILSGELSSPLEAITWLKKLCDHPSLVDNCRTLPCPEELISQSAKLNVLVHLVMRLKKSRHRCLIFSPSTKILDIIENVLPMKLGRIDGSVKGKDRQAIVDDFNRDENTFDALLISTKAGGVGLTLTGADRAILFSPSWNPADDNQAVDRCYRIGQRKNVTVYRFITAGTVEEHMYSKQVHKDGIRRTLVTTSGCSTERHFSADDLRRLFELGPIGKCKMLETINQKLEGSAQGSSGRRSVLETHDKVIGVSSHDLVYQNKIIDLVQPQQSPFAGTPLKSLRPSGKSNLPVRHLSFGELTRNKSDNGDVKESDNLTIPLKASTKHNKTDAEEKSKNEKGEKIQSLSYRKIETVDKALHQVDSLTADGNLRESLDQLFDLLEFSDLDQTSKLTVHKKIASRAILYYGWK